MGRKTITGILAAQGEIVNDWSSVYRIFEKKRFCVEKLFQPIREYVVSQLEENQPLTVFMDDTRIKKRGKKIYGTAWNRDPLGPKFQTNFIWGQRFLQLALALPSNKGNIGMARAIPIGFHHVPTLKKPKKSAPIEDWNKWKEESKKYKLPKIGINKLRILRNQLDLQGQSSRKIIASVDGGYTNIACIKNLPKRCTLIGRIRKDAKIFKIPENEIHKKGRKKYYGDPLPTPEQFRQNSEIQWTQCEAFAAGKMHKFDIKVVQNFRWNGAGETNLTLIIVRPLAYRLTKKSKLLYRDPAYIICTDTELDPQKILQSFVWRWEIEVNFRDEKTLIGVGEAQVREKNAASIVPSFIVATFAFLQITCHKLYGFNEPEGIIKPSWQKNTTSTRLTTQKMIGMFRASIWKDALGISKNDNFESKGNSFMKSILFGNSLLSAVFFGVK